MIAVVLSFGLLIVAIVTTLYLESYLVDRKMRHWSGGQKSFHHWLTENVFYPRARRQQLLIAGAVIVLLVVYGYFIDGLLGAILVAPIPLIFGWARAMMVVAPRDAYRGVCLIESIAQSYRVEVNWWMLDEKRFADWGQYEQWPDYLQEMEKRIIRGLPG